MSNNTRRYITARITTMLGGSFHHHTTCIMYLGRQLSSNNILNSSSYTHDSYKRECNSTTNSNITKDRLHRPPLETATTTTTTTDRHHPLLSRHKKLSFHFHEGAKSVTPLAPQGDRMTSEKRHARQTRNARHRHARHRHAIATPNTQRTPSPRHSSPAPRKTLSIVTVASNQISLE